jgi:hypothetical protein
MKITEFRKLIREEVQKTLKEVNLDKLSVTEGVSVKLEELPADIIDTLKLIRSTEILTEIEIVNNTAEVYGKFRSFSTDELLQLTENRRFLKMVFYGNETVLIFQLNKNEL